MCIPFFVNLNQGFLLSSAQQTVDKLISQTQDGIKLLKKNELNSPSGDTNADVISHAENLIHDSEKAKQVSISFCFHLSKIAFCDHSFWHCKCVNTDKCKSFSN